VSGQIISSVSITATNIYSDTWRKSTMVLHLYRESNWGSGSRFVIQSNLLLSEYYRLGVQWRWMFGVSSEDNNYFVWVFFCAMYNANTDSFSAHTSSGGGNISVYQNWDGSGWNRCIIDVNVGNPPNYLNVNFY
jgi:hypothetical protein